MPSPLILDFDASLAGLAGAGRIDLGAWQEAVRFGCSWRIWRELSAWLAECMPKDYGPVCMGSGDFHHLSHLLLARVPAGTGPLDVVVFDNHPDNMRFPFGIHCGSWVHHAARLPGVVTVHVLGITSGDITLAHAWENHLGGLYRGKVHYWSIGTDMRWAHAIGLGRVCHAFENAEDMLSAVLVHLEASRRPLYLSIDKDVLSDEEVRTNWDQGCLRMADLYRVMAMLKGRLLGGDITGEVSAYSYQTRWKRFLSALDGQQDIAADELTAWQARQTEATQCLIAGFAAAGC